MLSALLRLQSPEQEGWSICVKYRLLLRLPVCKVALGYGLGNRLHNREDQDKIVAVTVSWHMLLNTNSNYLLFLFVLTSSNDHQ